MQLFAVAQTFLLAAEEGAEEAGGLSLLLPETAELVWGIIGFSILMAFMAKYAFPKINELLEQRGAAIQGQITEAEAARADAERLRRQYEEQLADSRGEASAIIEEARQQGERLRADIVSKAEQDASQIVARAREDVEAERGRMMADLRSQVAVLSVELAGKIVQKELDPAQHRALVDSYINELSGLN